MFIQAIDPLSRLSLYRDVLAVYKKLIVTAFTEYGIDIKSVEVKNTVTKNINRAPLIVIERGDYQHIPRSLMFGEKIVSDPNVDSITSMTSHMIEYPIEFTCFGNSYLEAEKLGGLAMEAILTTGLSIVKRMHPNIIGSEFVSWGKTGLVEGGESSLVACSVLGKVFLHIDGIYSVEK